MVTLTHLALLRVMLYALVLGMILMMFVLVHDHLSKLATALLAVSATCWFVLLVYQFSK